MKKPQGGQPMVGKSSILSSGTQTPSIFIFHHPLVWQLLSSVSLWFQNSCSISRCHTGFQARKYKSLHLRYTLLLGKRSPAQQPCGVSRWPKRITRPPLAGRVPISTGERGRQERRWFRLGLERAYLRCLPGIIIQWCPHATKKLVSISHSVTPKPLTNGLRRSKAMQEFTSPCLF